MEKNEIFPGLTVEEIRALFTADALIEPNYRVYQLNTEGHRYYYRFEDGKPVFYPSVTTLLKQVMPTPPALIDWMIANGKSGSVEKRDLAAAYGTFMHSQFESLIINRRYDFDAVPSGVSEYMAANNIPESVFSEWCVKIRKDVLAFAQFVKDYNVKPIAIEIALVHPNEGYAGCIDMPCEMTDPKTKETFSAIVDFKSGRKGFFEEHEIQLHLYARMWNFNIPNKPVSRVFNFSPKDWRKAPSYNLKDQTNAESALKIPALLQLAKIEDAKRENRMTIVHGVLNLDGGNISDNLLELSLAELIQKKTESKSKADVLPSAKAVETPKEEKRPVTSKSSKKAANRLISPFDVCNSFCNEKNCDYELRTHGEKCLAAEDAARAVVGVLPWDKVDSAPKQNDSDVIAERLFDGTELPDAKPVPDANVKGIEALSGSLLNDEIDL